MTKLSSSLVLYDFIRFPLQFYHVAGVKLFQWDENDVWSRKQMCYMIFVPIYMIVSFGSKLSYPYFAQFSSSLHLTEWMLYSIFVTNGLCKVLSVVFGRKSLYAVLKDIEKIFPKTRKEREDFRLSACYSYIMCHSKIVGISHCVIALMFIAFPAVQSILEFIQSDDENRTFVVRYPYILTFPYDEYTGIMYVPTYMCQIFAGGVTSCYFVGSDMLLMCTIYLVIKQYAYLCHRIENFESKGYEMDMRELKEVLQRHNIVNEAAYTVNKIFRISILLNYIISILVIVLIGIQIITGSETLNLVKFVGFLCSSVIQMYYVCKFGTELMDASTRISDALMGQAWYMADIRYQRIIVLAIARSHKASRLTAFKFFPISMESFSNVMTTSYQIFTLLSAQMEEQQN